MMRAGLHNFSKGEISDELIARVDVATYSSALKQAKNVIVLKYGGVAKRPGTHLVAEAYDITNPVRLLPFQFSLTSAYAMEMGQGYMRPAAFGGLVLETALTITAITKALHAKITSAYHGYSVGQQIFFSGIQGMTEMNGLTGTVLSAIDANNYTVDIDSTAFSTFTGDTGGTANTGPPPPPPTPPAVPPPVDPPAPPRTGGGGRYSDDDSLCVTVDTLILLADGSEKPAGELQPGDMVWTQHELTFEWGDYKVTHAENAWADHCYDVDGLVASKGHRTWRIDRWVEHESIGIPVGGRMVAHITVEDAHTYVSAGVLSHNIKNLIP